MIKEGDPVNVATTFVVTRIITNAEGIAVGYEVALPDDPNLGILIPSSDIDRIETNF